MKQYRKPNAYSCHEDRKAWHEKQNAMIKDRMATPESSVLGSGVFSNEISLNSLSLRTESCDGIQSRAQSDRLFSGKSTFRAPNSSTYILEDFDNRCISEEDKKILRLMALRRKAAIEEEENAFSARNIWAEEIKLHTKCMEERKKSWNEYITQKRKIEEIESCRRKKNQANVLKNEKTMLESKINEKHQRFERRQEELSAQKRLGLGGSTESQIQLHKQIKEQKDREEELQNALHIKLYKARERRIEEKHRCILLEKYRRIKEESMRRDLKWQAAKDMREELNKKQSEVQEQNLKKFQSDQLLSQYRVNWALEWKKKLLFEKNRMKKQHHSFIINKLKDENVSKEMQAREMIQHKDARLKYLQEKREMDLTRSRMNARVAADLRQKIKASYNI